MRLEDLQFEVLDQMLTAGMELFDAVAKAREDRRAATILKQRGRGDGDGGGHDRREVCRIHGPVEHGERREAGQGSSGPPVGRGKRAREEGGGGSVLSAGPTEPEEQGCGNAKSCPSSQSEG